MVQFVSNQPSMSVQKEVTRGVFDPRTYREDDPVNWARKRRSDWLAVTGKIHYVRERTVASQEREIQEQKQRAEEEVKNQEEVPEQEPPVQEEEVPKMNRKMEIPQKEEKTEFWPRKKRSDLTMSRVI